TTSCHEMPGANNPTKATCSRLRPSQWWVGKKKLAWPARLPAVSRRTVNELTQNFFSGAPLAKGSKAVETKVGRRAGLLLVRYHLGLLQAAFLHGLVARPGRRRAAGGLALLVAESRVGAVVEPQRGVLDLVFHVRNSSPRCRGGGRTVPAEKINAANGLPRSHVQLATVRGKHALVHHLGQRRVREDRLHQLGLGRLEHLADRVALDQFGDFGADHVRAEQFAGPGVEHGFDEALGLAERDRLAVADERKRADPDLVAGLLGLGLGQADAGDLRTAVGAARDRVAVERVRVDLLVAKLLRDRLGRGDALVAGLVREPR